MTGIILLLLSSLLSLALIPGRAKGKTERQQELRPFAHSSAVLVFHLLYIF